MIFRKTIDFRENLFYIRENGYEEAKFAKMSLYIYVPVPVLSFVIDKNVVPLYIKVHKHAVVPQHYVFILSANNVFFLSTFSRKNSYSTKTGEDSNDSICVLLYCFWYF